MKRKCVVEWLKSNFWTIFISMVLLLLCVLNALSAGKNADFIPVNGDFQNYNVVRRFLNGQVPFTDFACYLGCGHLFLGSAITFLIGGIDNNLMDSKIAFQFLSLFSFVLTSVVIFNSIFRKKIDFSLFISVLAILLTASILFFIPKAPMIEFFVSGNSARGIRGMAPAFFIMCVLLLEKINDRLNRKLPIPVVYGIPTGMIVFYSNCYGMGSFFCAIILFTISSIFSKKTAKEKLRGTAIYLIVTIVSFLIFGSIITRGNIFSYIHALTATGGAQAWYYNSGKSFYFYNIDYFSLVQGLIALLYLFHYIKDIDIKEQRIRYGVPLFMNAVAFLTANEYKLLSGGLIHEVSSTILFLTIFGELLRYLLNKYSNNIYLTNINKYQFKFCVLIIVLASLFPIACKVQNNIKEDSTYVAHVGNMYDLGDAILSTDEFMKKDDVVFSTYASGLEAYRCQFQPSGYDYIIHVLGDDAINQYMSCFREGNFNYVATQRESYTNWEYWIKYANWYFYRELYRMYEPVYANKYELFWKKRKKELETPSIGCIRVEKLNRNKSKIILESKEMKYGIADVELSYQVKKDESLMSFLTLNTMVHVDNSNTEKISQTDKYWHVLDHYYLNKNANGSHIGIAIVDGYGEITITCQPENNTYIAGLDVKLEGVIADDCLNYAVVHTARSISDSIELEIDNTPKNKILTREAKSIKVNGCIYNASFRCSNNNSVILVDIKQATPDLKDVLIGHKYYPVIYIL